MVFIYPPAFQPTGRTTVGGIGQPFPVTVIIRTGSCGTVPGAARQDRPKVVCRESEHDGAGVLVGCIHIPDDGRRSISSGVH